MKMDVTQWIMIHAVSKSAVLTMIPGMSGVFSGFMIHSSIRVMERIRSVRNFLHRLRQKLFDYVFAEIVA